MRKADDGILKSMLMLASPTTHLRRALRSACVPDFIPSRIRGSAALRRLTPHARGTSSARRRSRRSRAREPSPYLRILVKRAARLALSVENRELIPFYWDLRSTSAQARGGSERRCWRSLRAHGPGRCAIRDWDVSRQLPLRRLAGPTPLRSLSLTLGFACTNGWACQEVELEAVAVCTHDGGRLCFHFLRFNALAGTSRSCIPNPRRSRARGPCPPSGETLSRWIALASVSRTTAATRLRSGIRKPW
ncbi:hypothetical protein C8R45DRAFT_360948 [Mycena sanguinolenta]|nr:hypothetical protein C8R45DRAFT_360948 [Mycena sanguinolenta]